MKIVATRPGYKTAALALCAVIAVVSWSMVGYELVTIELPRTPPCADTRPGLWLTRNGDDSHISGSAPPATGILAAEVANTHWGYLVGRLCSDRWASSSNWDPVIEAVYRAPLDRLRRGTVLVRPDIVVIAGEATSRERRSELEASVRRNLVEKNVPLIVEVAVALDPKLPAQLDALTLRFDSNAHVLPAHAERELSMLTHALRINDGTIVVTGHADASGRPKTNETLARLRAESVRDRLRHGGIPESRIVVRSEGARSPVADNATEAGRAANRRVSIRIVPDQPSR